MTRTDQSRWSRRAVLGSAALAGASLLLSRHLRAATATVAADPDAIMSTLSKRPLISKLIPSSGERIPAIGIGTNAFYLANYEPLKAMLQRMVEMSGAVIDTADDYPNPNAEESELVIGRALAELGLRRRTLLCTKFNADGFQAASTPLDRVYGREAFERSLQRLQTDKVDVLYVHHVPSIDPLMPLLQEIKKSGKARYVGMTMLRPTDRVEFAEKMRQYPVDFVQFPYSIGNRSAAETLLPLAHERKMAVTLDVPLAGLASALKHALPPWAVDLDVTSWAQFMLKYAISHPAVTAALPGSTNIEHLMDNQLAARGRLPDAAMRKKMEQYWDATVGRPAAP